MSQVLVIHRHKMRDKAIISDAEKINAMWILIKRYPAGLSQHKMG